MIIINDNIATGDIVYAWFSPYKEKNKVTEHEYRINEYVKDKKLSIHSTDGDYDMIFDNNFLMSWNGNVRRA